MNDSQHTPESTVDYEGEKTRWMASYGSQRLKLAAERGYKHDGIYRDERAAQELPGFLALAKAKAKECINPTAEAIEFETDVMSRVASLTPVHSIVVRIVWLDLNDTDTDLPNGEYVMVDGYLGKHKLYLPVEESTHSATGAENG